MEEGVVSPVCHLQHGSCVACGSHNLVGADGVGDLFAHVGGGPCSVFVSEWVCLVDEVVDQVTLFFRVVFLHVNQAQFVWHLVGFTLCPAHEVLGHLEDYEVVVVCATHGVTSLLGVGLFGSGLIVCRVIVIGQAGAV